MLLIVSDAGCVGAKELVAEFTVLLHALKFAGLWFLIEQINRGDYMGLFVKKKINAKHAPFELFSVKTANLKAIQR